MAWTFTEFRRWYRQDGVLLRVLAASGLLGAGALLWLDRDAPLYSSARDEAEIRGAIMERLAAAGVDQATNSTVMLYPPQGFYMVQIPEWTEGMHDRFIDLWPDGGSAGAAKIDGRQVSDYPLPWATNEVVGLAWWRSNVYAEASAFGDWRYTHGTNWYMQTNMLFEIARPLSAMRWTFIQSSGGSGPTNSFLQWTGIGSSSVNQASAIDAAHAECAAAVPEDFYGSFAGDSAALLATNVIRSHYIYCYAWDDAGWWYATIIERASIAYRQVCEPPATNCAVWNLATFGMPSVTRDENVFEHLGTTNVWLAAPAVRSTNDAGRIVFAESIQAWPGRLVDDVASPLFHSGDILYGWADGAYTRHWFLLDWQFQCLTNRAAFW